MLKNEGSSSCFVGAGAWKKSFTFDSSTRYWYTDSKPESYDMPTVMELKKVEAFKSTLSLSPEKIRELERKTRDQEEQNDSLQISFMKSLTD